MPEDQSREEWRPVSDPSFLTTQQLLRELTSMKEFFMSRVGAVEQAQEKFEENIQRVPTEVQKSVGELKELHEAKFSEVYTTIRNLNTLIDEKFLLRDKGVKETADLTSTALQAALAAAEKSAQKTSDSFVVSALKTEATFTKTQDAQAAAVSALSTALSDKVNDLKERVTASEARASGMGSLWGWIAGAIGLLIGLGGIAAVLFEALRK